MKVTYFGTTMLLFDDGKDQLLFDCHVSRPSVSKCIFGQLSTDRETSDRVINEFQMNRLRGIFVSHSHYDHVMDVPYFSAQCSADVYGSFSALNVARGGGVEESRLHSFDDSKFYEFGAFQITVIPSVHSKARGFNNDLGKPIPSPLKQPAKKSAFTEGGSYDFLISHEGRHYLIRPSYNYLEGQLDGIHADVMFLGIGGLSRDTKERQEAFFSETIDKTQAKTIIPLHWDDFFSPLYGDVRFIPNGMDNTGASMRILVDYCSSNDVSCIVMVPLASMVF